MKTILTKNLKRATKLAMTTIEKTEMGVISGMPGMGKTTFRDMLINRLKSEDFKVAYYIPFRKSGTQTNRILSAIYETCFPEQDIPANENKKIKSIQNAISGNDKIVLLIDNMQNLDIQTIRELKIIWEELKGLPIVFFLKSDTKIINLLNEVEIGQRVNHYTMKQLAPEEIIQIATKSHGLKFEDAITKKRFIGSVGGNPLTVKHFSKLAKELNPSGLVTLKVVTQLELKFLNLLRRQFQISTRDVVESLKEEGKDVSVGFANEALTGKRTMTNSGKTKGGASVEDILNQVKKLVEDKQK